MSFYTMTLSDSSDTMSMTLLEVPIEDKDIEGTTDNTTIDGNVFTDYLWLKSNSRKNGQLWMQQLMQNSVGSTHASSTMPKSQHIRSKIAIVSRYIQRLLFDYHSRTAE